MEVSAQRNRAEAAPQRSATPARAGLDSSPRSAAQLQCLQAAFGAQALQCQALGSESGPPVQRQLYHQVNAPFTALQAGQWNALVLRAAALELANIGAINTFVEASEVDIWSADTTVAAALPALRLLMTAGLNVLVRARNDANALVWGQMLAFMQEFTAFGVLTGPVNLAGHASDTYTYTGHLTGAFQSVAIETNAHGQTPVNLATRRGHLRNLMDIYNGEIAALIATL